MHQSFMSFIFYYATMLNDGVLKKRESGHERVMATAQYSQYI